MTSRCLGLLFSLFLGLICRQEMILARNILEKYLTENIEEIWANSFKIRAIEIEIKEQLSVRLTSQTSLFMFLQSAFQFGQYGNKKQRKNK